MWHESITKASLNSKDPLGEAFRLLLGFVQRLRAGEEQQLLRVAAAASAFLSFTGQLYSFEELRRGSSPLEEQVSHYDRERRLLEHMRESLPSEEMKGALSTAIAALGFVELTGQREGVEDYLEYWRNSTLPPVVAAFKTHEEAETWLNARTPLPYHAKVLIGDDLFMVLRSGATGRPRFARKDEIADFMEEHSRDGLPPVAASFATREEAESWFHALPSPPRNTFIQIQGVHHVAAYWKNVNHRALYSFARIKDPL